MMIAAAVLLASLQCSLVQDQEHQNIGFFGRQQDSGTIPKTGQFAAIAHSTEQSAAVVRSWYIALDHWRSDWGEQIDYQ